MSDSLKPHLPKPSMKEHASHPTRHGKEGEKGESMRPKDKIKGKAACKMCGTFPCTCSDDD